MSDENNSPTTNSQAYLKQQGATHLLAFLVALGVWSAFNSWQITSNLMITQFFAALSSVAAGIVMSHIFHEWGHFFGACLSHAKTTIKEKPAPLFFDFDYLTNTPKQYLWLSAGGPLGTSLIILLSLIFLPSSSTAEQWLLATLVGNLAFVLSLESGVSVGIYKGGQPLEVISNHFSDKDALFKRSMTLGVIAGFITLLLL